MDKNKGVVGIPINRAMDLVVAQLQSNKPHPAGPVNPPAARPGGISSALSKHSNAGESAMMTVSFTNQRGERVHLQRPVIHGGGARSHRDLSGRNNLEAMKQSAFSEPETRAESAMERSDLSSVDRSIRIPVLFFLGQVSSGWLLPRFFGSWPLRKSIRRLPGGLFRVLPG